MSPAHQAVEVVRGIRDHIDAHTLLGDIRAPARPTNGDLA
jgi:hypothetical protein